MGLPRGGAKKLQPKDFRTILSVDAASLDVSKIRDISFIDIPSGEIARWGSRRRNCAAVCRKEQL
jgi:hypothetical protein